MTWHRRQLLNFKEQFQHDGDKSQSTKYKLLKQLVVVKATCWKSQHQKSQHHWKCVVNWKGYRSDKIFWKEDNFSVLKTKEESNDGKVKDIKEKFCNVGGKMEFIQLPVVSSNVYQENSGCSSSSKTDNSWCLHYL